jgi:hypothetical protein
VCGDSNFVIGPVSRGCFTGRIPERVLVPDVARNALADRQAAMVNDQADREGRVLVPEKTDLLRRAMLEDFKIRLAGFHHRVAQVVAHSSLQHHQVDVYGNPVCIRIRFR